MKRLPRVLLAVSIASTILAGAWGAARLPWRNLAAQDDAPIELFFRDAVRRIPPQATVLLDCDLFGLDYAIRFYPRPVLAPGGNEAEIARHPEAWIVKFDSIDFDPARARIEAPRAGR